MSDQPLRTRLQVKGTRRLAVVDAPEGIDDLIGAGDARAELENADVVVQFTRDRHEFEIAVVNILRAARPIAILWVAYPKLTSRFASDLNRDVIRSLAPGYGLDSVSQIAIDADWSALRLKRSS